MLKLEKYIMRAKDFQWFKFSVILIAEGNRFSVVEKDTNLVYFLKPCVSEEKRQKKLTNRERINST